MRALRLLAALAALGMPASSRADVIFEETFDGYTEFPDPGGVNDGVPDIPEGADEFWYAGRFGSFSGTTLLHDLAVAAPGGGNATPAGRVEDNAGIILRIPPGYRDLTLHFDWRTSSVDPTDRLVGGYFTGNLYLDQGANRERDFFNLDFGGDEAAITQWWQTEWVEFLRGQSGSWQTHPVVLLPAGQELWIAFWLDDGEGDFGLLDGVRVEGTPIPTDIPLAVPALFALALGALGALAAARRGRGSPGEASGGAGSSTMRRSAARSTLARE
jgi:hypothetical protein